VGLKETTRARRHRDQGADLEVVAFRRIRSRRFSAFFEAGARLGAKHILVAPTIRAFAVRRSLCPILRGCGALRPHRRSRNSCPGRAVPDLKTASRIIEQVGQSNAGVLSMPCILTGRKARSRHRPKFRQAGWHYWQLCDAPAERRDTGRNDCTSPETIGCFQGRRTDLVHWRRPCRRIFRQP